MIIGIESSPAVTPTHQHAVPGTRLRLLAAHVDGRVAILHKQGILIADGNK